MFWFQPKACSHISNLYVFTKNTHTIKWDCIIVLLGGNLMSLSYCPCCQTSNKRADGRAPPTTDLSSVWAIAAAAVAAKLSAHALDGQRKASPLIAALRRLSENPTLASILLLHLWHSHLSQCITSYESDLDMVGSLHSKPTVLNMNSQKKCA